MRILYLSLAFLSLEFDPPTLLSHLCTPFEKKSLLTLLHSVILGLLLHFSLHTLSLLLGNLHNTFNASLTLVKIFLELVPLRNSAGAVAGGTLQTPQQKERAVLSSEG